MGRNSKLTPELQEKICESLENGNYIETTCLSVGINQSTFYDWLNRGEQENNSLYTEFSKAVTRSQAKAEEKLLKLVLDSAPKDWRAAVWILERRFSERWANTQRVNILVEKQLEEITNALQNKLSPEVYETVIRAIAEGYHQENNSEKISGA